MKNKSNSKKEYDKNIKKASNNFLWASIIFTAVCAANLLFDTLKWELAHNFINDFLLPFLSAFYIPAVYAMIGKYFKL